MDSVYVIAGTVLLGLVGAAVFFLTQQPAQAKSRSAGGLKPRDDWHAQ